MVAENLLNDLFALPISDRLELFNRLRENLRNDPELAPLSAEHKRILEERLVDVEHNPDDESDWDKVEAEVLASLDRKP